MLGAGGAGVGTHHRPHSVRSCEPTLHAVGVAGGRPRGNCLAPLWGSACGRRCGGVETRYWPSGLRALRDVARRGAGGRLPQRGVNLSPLWGESGVRCSPSPDCLSLRRASGPHCAFLLAAGGAGMGTRHWPHSMRSCKSALRAVGMAGRRPLGGWCLAPLRGAFVVERSSSPGCRSLGQAVRAGCPLAVGAGVRVWTQHCPFGLRALRSVARRRSGGRLPQGRFISPF